MDAYCGILYGATIGLQVIGMLSAGCARLAQSARVVAVAKVVLVISLLGLGTASALCGREESGFALVAGATLAILLLAATMEISVSEENVAAS
jgi:hypothetical protein